MLTGQWYDDIIVTSCRRHAMHALFTTYCSYVTVHRSTVHIVGPTGIRVWSTHPGEEDAWGAYVRVGRRLAGE